MTDWGITSETGRLRDVLLCRPENYAWSPANRASRETLASGVTLDRDRLLAQYAEFEHALDQAGVTRHYLTPEPHLPYQVYTRDSSQMTPWGAVPLMLQAEVRRGEWGSIVDFYEGAGIPRFAWATRGKLEGGDIHVIRPGLLLIGYSDIRSDLEGARQFAGWFEGWEARFVPFPDFFLHYDTLFCMAAEGLGVACLDVMDEETQAWLRGHGIELIDVPYKAAARAGCNLLALGDGRVISPAENAELNAKLRARGIEVLDPEYRLFTMGGGSVRCTSMALRRDP
ncbi:MAG: arginine deiminase family protein [Azospirillaceae bacterium]